MIVNKMTDINVNKIKKIRNVLSVVKLLALLIILVTLGKLVFGMMYDAVAYMNNEKIDGVEERLVPLTETHTVNTESGTYVLNKKQTDELHTMIYESKSISEDKVVSDGKKIGTLKVTDKDKDGVKHLLNDYIMYEEKGRILLSDQKFKYHRNFHLAPGYNAFDYSVIEGKDVSKFKKLISK